VKTVSPTARVQKTPDDHLGLGVAPFDAAHQPAALLSRKTIDH
jgi:hypothetical protein